MKISAKKIKEWAEMTEENLHSERLVDIAVYFKQYDYATMFNRFAEMTSMTMADLDERNRLWEGFLARLRKDYGADLAHQVYHLK